MFVQRAIVSNAAGRSKDVAFWQINLFKNVMIYSLPLSAIALVPSVVTLYNDGRVFLVCAAIFTLLSIGLVSLNKKINLGVKKAYVVVMLYVLAITLTATLGAFGIGCVYILALSVFIALLFPRNVAYASIVVNFLIYACFTAIIYFKLFNSPLISHYTMPYWVTYSLNFLFLDVAVIVQIRYLTNGLRGTIEKKAKLLKELRAEITEKIIRNDVLKESEQHYYMLFSLNPSPMWIYDAETLYFLQVNKAAIEHYGYTEDDFLNMTIKDIRPKSVLPDLLNTLQHNRTEKSWHMTTQHRDKYGNDFHVEVRCSTIPFKGREARLVIAQNITEQINHTQAIERQNTKLKEIAFIQSHLVRAPLARIIGLSAVIRQNLDEPVDQQILGFLDTSVNELDQIIRSVVNNSQEIFPEDSLTGQVNNKAGVETSDNDPLPQIQSA
ncbi:PAS domain S-box protein [Mucilaginibacter terrenus]|uniref:PAS domain S-box protein n=1 Tax=Mucilaginibacter terrenus TaxID=2482727 RepID=A0A3E2NTG0_9SPHI|nr:PAS domain S-box protein [Mucilaginibacter terrenus]